jgi:hypothetical protein
MDYKDKVRIYLENHYNVTAMASNTLVERHAEIVEDGQDMASRPYYAADKIAYKEELKHAEPCENCRREEAADEE